MLLYWFWMTSQKNEQLLLYNSKLFPLICFRDFRYFCILIPPGFFFFFGAISYDLPISCMQRVALCTHGSRDLQPSVPCILAWVSLSASVHIVVSFPVFVLSGSDLMFCSWAPACSLLLGASRLTSAYPLCDRPHCPWTWFLVTLGFLCSLSISCLFPVSQSLISECPPCQCFRRHLIPWIPTPTLFIMQGAFCLFHSRRQTGVKGRKGNIGSLGLLVMMPPWCWVYQTPHDPRLCQDPVYLRKQDSLWHPGWPHSDGATQLPSQKSARIWCH